jgi:hypothetical protein
MLCQILPAEKHKTDLLTCDAVCWADSLAVPVRPALCATKELLVITAWRLRSSASCLATERPTRSPNWSYKRPKKASLFFSTGRALLDPM